MRIEPIIFALQDCENADFIKVFLSGAAVNICMYITYVDIKILTINHTHVLTQVL